MNPIVNNSNKPINFEKIEYKNNLKRPNGAGYLDPKSIILKTIN